MLFLILSALGLPLVDDSPSIPVAAHNPPALASQESDSLNAKDQAARRAVERGLEHLIKRQAQSADGSISTADAKNRAPLGITALSALAFMAAGNTPATSVSNASATVRRPLVVHTSSIARRLYWNTPKKPRVVASGGGPGRVKLAIGGVYKSKSIRE